MCDPFDMDASTAMVKSIQNVVDFATNLEYFFVSIHERLENRFGEIYGSLEKLCGRNSFKALKLKATDKCLGVNAYRLKNLKKLKKMDLSSYAKRLYDSEGLTQLVDRFVHIKSITVPYETCEHFPNFWGIEELNIYAYDRVEEASLLIYLTDFIRHMKHLKKVSVLKNASIKDKVTFPVSKMNAARKKLKGAVGLTIFTNFDENTTNLDHALVKLRRVECSSISSHIDCTLCQWSDY